MGRVRPRQCWEVIGVLAALFLGCDRILGAELKLALSEETVSFELAGAESPGPWALQFSSDLRTWNDVAFLEGVDAGRIRPSIEVAWAALPGSSASKGYFRAQLVEDASPIYQRYLNQRARWNGEGIQSYQYELRQNFGIVFWAGRITVADGEVAGFQVLELIPPFLDISDVPSIDDLFDRIENAIERQAVEIDVQWNEDLGYPESGYIDFDRRIADEEQGWSIVDFTAAP